ncbi:MAG: hypothetical protein JST16_01540 [Bdellovibrionales bacterium]|nr:hypothetical protein [Bdellovibrionales bacterium]
MSQEVAAESAKMSIPSFASDHAERELNYEEDVLSDKSRKERQEIVLKLGADLGSEQAMFSAKFGYVYRYILVQRQGAGNFVYRAKVVIWTKDFKQFRVAMQPESPTTHQSP